MTIRSKKGLTRCGSCGRHVRADVVENDVEVPCPFCAGVSVTPRTRGMALAGALVLAACGGGAEEPTPGGESQGGESVEVDDTPTPEGGTENGTEDGVADGSDGTDGSGTDTPGQDEPGATDPEEPMDPPVVALYGVPPMD